MSCCLHAFRMVSLFACSALLPMPFSSINIVFSVLLQTLKSPLRIGLVGELIITCIGLVTGLASSAFCAVSCVSKQALTLVSNQRKCAFTSRVRSPVRLLKLQQIQGKVL